jgi:ABC-type transporter lipoprotein component MlaA
VPILWRRASGCASLAFSLALLASGCASVPSDTDAATNSAVLGNDALYAPPHGEGFSVLVYTEDPLERANRVSLRLTKGALDYVAQPLALGYRALVPELAREALSRFYGNLNYPGRFVSLLLQGRLKDSGEETGRFLVNSTAGVLGLFDPAARLKLDSFPEDVGQAFGRWGIRPGPYLFLPMLGPSNARDAVGRLFDMALDPATYLTGATLAFGLNSFSLRVDDYRDLSAAEADWYAPIRTYWAIRREAEVENYRIPQSAFEASDPEPSLGVLKFSPQDPSFGRRAKERKLALPSTGKTLRYSLWLQPEPAPLLFVLPGIGSHRRGGTTVALAERAFARGFSVVAISSAFQPEVQLAVLRSPYPGYAPHDAADLRATLEAIYADVSAWKPGHVTSASLIGLSLGAAHALHIAAQPEDALRFERIVAVNPPVDFLVASRRFDEFFDAPLRWPADERDRRVLEIGKKALALFDGEVSDPRLPFDRIESEFLIGLNGRDAVHNAMVAIQTATGRGVLLQPELDPARGWLLEEVNHSSFDAYVRHLVLPHFLGSDPNTSVEGLLEASGLHEIAPALAANPRVAIFTNADDFLLGEGDAAWLRAALGERVTIFPQGGHLGNLSVPEVQDAIFRALSSAP